MSYLPIYPPLEVQSEVMSPNSCGIELLAFNGGIPNNGVCPAANLATYIPLMVQENCTVYKMWVANGATVAGNVDVGLYKEDGTKVVTIGSTAMAGATVIQIFDIADTALTPQRYYMAFATDSATATFQSWRNITVLNMQAFGVFQQATAFALPSPATFATCSQQFIPWMGIALRATV